MEATSSCTTMVTFTNQHSATFLMIRIFINTAERTTRYYELGITIINIIIKELQKMGRQS